MRFVCWMLICLFMPLRAWAADAMLMDHPIQNAPPQAQAVAQEMGACHGEHAAQAATPDADTGADSTLSCQTCDLCHALAYTDPVTAALSAAPVTGKPHALQAPIRSASLPPDYRPPIA